MRLTESLDIDSHGVYDLHALANQLVKDGVAKLTGTADRSITLEHLATGQRFMLSGLTVDELARIADPRKVGPKGYYRDPAAKGDELVAGGYQIAATLAQQLTGDSPGGQYLGRGFAFRADWQRLREQGY